MSTPRCGAHRAILRIPLRQILPNPRPPRRQLSEDSIDNLAESIRLHGQLSPLLVRELGEGRYQLIAGERRRLALERLGRPWAEAVALQAGELDGALIALVENVQREELHFLDLALACRDILDRRSITQERLAASLGCSPSALANRLRLLRLPPRVQQAIRERGLSERHARALLGLEGEGAQLAMAAMAADRRLSVKQLEALVARRDAPAKSPAGIRGLVRDNRIVVNAVLDTVRRLTRIGVPIRSRVEEQGDHIDVIITIPAARGRGEPSAKGD